MTVNDVTVRAPDEVTETEIKVYLAEVEPYKNGHRLVELDIELDGDEVILRPHYDTIIRVRRITGYLSTISQFNDAKKREERDRVRHVGVFDNY